MTAHREENVMSGTTRRDAMKEMLMGGGWEGAEGEVDELDVQ